MNPLKAGDPELVGGYRLLGRLGTGGMAQVFLGTSPGGRKVAVKLIRPEYADDAEFRRRFAREIAAARQVGGFHTAAVVDADPDADPPWMVTAYIPGPSLSEAVGQNGPLDQAQVRELGAALAEGLTAIHACGLIHRDLKPGNIILGPDGPRIIDFGVARTANASLLTTVNALIGTYGYMAPEQLGRKEVTNRSDLFALGGVLVFAATGHGPFDADELPAVIGRILSEPPDLSPLTGSLRDILGACLNKDPGSRPGLDELIDYFGGPEQARRPSRASGRRRPGDAPTAVSGADRTALPGSDVPRWPGSRGRRPEGPDGDHGRPAGRRHHRGPGRPGGHHARLLASDRPQRADHAGGVRSRREVPRDRVGRREGPPLGYRVLAAGGARPVTGPAAPRSRRRIRAARLHPRRPGRAGQAAGHVGRVRLAGGLRAAPQLAGQDVGPVHLPERPVPGHRRDRGARALGMGRRRAAVRRRTRCSARPAGALVS